MRVFLCVLFVFFPLNAMAFVDLSLAPFIPITMDAISITADSVYNLGKNLFPNLIYIFLAIKISLYVFKMYMPKDWMGVLGISGAGGMYGTVKSWDLVYAVGRPIMRAVMAIILLLPLSPKIMTSYAIDPILEFGSIYTSKILEAQPELFSSEESVNLNENTQRNFSLFSEKTSYYLMKPVKELSKKNNEFILIGAKLLLHGLLTLSFLTVISGIMMIIAFFSSNLFITLLIIQAIFDLGIALVFYPFYVLSYVVKDSEEWLNPIGVFKKMFSALKVLVITMIVSAIVVILNIQMIKALYSAGDIDTFERILSIEDANQLVGSFGFQFMTWLYAIIMIILFYKIFDITRGKIKEYGGEGDESFYNTVKTDADYLIKKGKEQISKFLETKAKEK